MLAGLILQRHQAAEVDRDVVGLALVRILYLSRRHAQHAPGKRETAAQGSIIRAAERDLPQSRVGARPAGRRRPACAAARVVVARFKDDGYSALKEIRRG